MQKSSVETAAALNPILLTTEGDFLEEASPRHIDDDTPLGAIVLGVHSKCGAKINRFAATTAMRDTALCDRCALRFTFPSTTATYGDLRHSREEELSADRPALRLP